MFLLQELLILFMRAKELNFSGKTINSLKIVKLIGQGNWADVYLAEEIQSHQKAAVKVTPLKKLVEIPKLQELVKAQIAILKQCHNPNVVRLISDFIHSDHQFIVLEYCSGFELGDILLRQKKLQEPLAVNYLKQILNGFKGLHQVKAMHRDFKVQNVMLHEGVCKIVDLGFGKQLIGEQVTRTKLGSNLTMAPEVMMGLPYDFKADIWSIGVVFYQMLFGKFPIQARTPMALLEKARKNQYSLQEYDVSEQCKDFIKRCLKFDPLERINWVQIYKHPLIADQNNEVNVGPPQSKINVSQNQEFYLALEKKLQIQFAPTSVINQRQSHKQQKNIEPHAIKSIIRSSLLLQKKQEIQHYQRMQKSQQEVFQKEPSQIFLSGIREQARINQMKRTQQAKHLQLAKRQEELSEEILRNERLEVSTKVKNIKYLYIQKLQDIEFMSKYALTTMRDTINKSEINHIPIICLLLKDAYLRLQKLNDQVNLRINTFKVDEIDFAYFADDQEVPEMLRNHMQEYRQMFYENCGFLSEEEYGDQRLRKALQSITSKDDFPDWLLDDYLKRHAKLISNVDLSNSWTVYCKLLKLSFCLVKYSKHKNNNFSRKRILASVNNINHQRQYLEQLNQANQRHNNQIPKKYNYLQQNVVHYRKRKRLPIFGGFFKFIFGP